MRTSHKLQIDSPCAFKSYIAQLYRDLINRCEKSSSQGVSLSSFCKFMGLPMIVSSKLFSALDVNMKGYLTEEEMCNGMYDIFAGDINRQMDLAFSSLDFNKAGIIQKSDARLILAYLSKIDCTFTSQQLQETVNQIFGEDTSISKEDARNSGLLSIFINFIFSYNPLHEENLNYYFSLVNEKNESETEVEKDRRYEDNFIPIYEKMTRENKFDWGNEAAVNNLTMNLLQTKSESTQKSQNVLETLCSLKQTEAYIKNSNTLQSIKLVLLNRDLFCLEWKNDKQLDTISQIVSLRHCIVVCGEPIIYQQKTYYPFQIRDSFSNKKKSVDFFIDNPNEFSNFTKHIKEAIGQRKIIDEYEILKSLSKGQYGTVKLGVVKQTGQKVAIKIIEKSKIIESSMIQWEIDIFKFLKNSHHPGIVQALDYFENANSIYLVYEYVSGGNLTAYLHNRTEYLSESELRNFSIQIAESIAFLHENGIIHRDIKPENILVQEFPDQSVQLKLTDFGLSKVMGTEETTNESYGTPCYAAPEILMKIPYNHKADIWTYGVLLNFVKGLFIVKYS